jgi:hypothetical protein
MFEAPKGIGKFRVDQQSVHGPPLGKKSGWRARFFRTRLRQRFQRIEKPALMLKKQRTASEIDTTPSLLKNCIKENTSQARTSFRADRSLTA